MVSPLYAKEYPTIKAIVNPKTVTVGERIQYKIVISGKEISEDDIKIILPEKREFFLKSKKIEKKDKNESEKESKLSSSFVPLYIINNIAKKDDSNSTIYLVSVIVDMVYYIPGKYKLPEIEIRDSKNILVGYKIPELEVVAFNKDGKFEKLEPPFDLGGNYTRVVYLILFVILLTLVIVFIVLYLRKRAKLKKEKIPKKNAIELFRDDIVSMNGIDLITNGDIEGYATSISLIFRKFLSNLYGIDAVEMTTDQISTLIKQKLTKQQFEVIGVHIINSFYLWDLSKFAEFAPSKEILLKNHKDIMKLAEKLFIGGI